MEKINELVNDYNNNKITWHDIQDIVAGQIALKYGVSNWKESVIEENKILEEIEKKITN